MMRFSCRSRWPLVLLMALTTSALESSGAQVVYGPGAKYPSTKADADFMQGMIGHHAQAIVMAKEAKSHGASPAVQVFCERIDVAQTNEIRLMQNWLRERHFTVPDSTGAMAMEMPDMPGMTHTMVMFMPGMLTPEQMQLLDEARGPSWDRLFLTFMIQHHQGALTMVDTLFNSPGAGQDETIFKFATAVHADQTAEIDRMKSMLAGGRRH